MSNTVENFNDGVNNHNKQFQKMRASVNVLKVQRNIYRNTFLREIYNTRVLGELV